MRMRKVTDAAAAAAATDDAAAAVFFFEQRRHHLIVAITGIVVAVTVADKIPRIQVFPNSGGSRR